MTRPTKAALLARIAALETSLQQEADERKRLEHALAESLEQQTAAADILRVISQSPIDVQPVFDAIVRSAVRLCGALRGNVQRFDGELLHLVAAHNYPREGLEEARGAYPMRPSRSRAAGRAVLTGTVAHVPDTLEDPEYDPDARRGLRSILSVPMLREGTPIGVISVGRATAGPFSFNQIELLKTFADQAVIAVENTRLFTELGEKNKALTAAHAEVTEALAQQTATAEILRVISSSPTELQPVMDAVAENAARICGASDATIRLVEGDTLRLVARFGSIPLGAPDAIPHSREYPMGRAIIERRTIHIDDVLPLRDTEFPAITTDQRTVLATPLMREGQPIGAILIRRVEMQPFTGKQVALLETFADQAVIAIENARHFNETREALERQTATAEVLRVIGSSPTDTQPVFDVIAANAMRVCGALGSAVLRVEQDMVHLTAVAATSPEWMEAARALYPHPVNAPRIDSRVVQERRLIQLADIEHHPEATPGSVALARAMGYRTFLMVPMLHSGQCVGVIAVVRKEPTAFAPRQVELLQTFADQAVIAIENVRLFNELQARNRDLTESLEQQTATSEILRVISQSRTDVQAVFDAIATSAQRLCDALTGNVYTFDGELIRLASHANVNPAGSDLLHRMPPRAPSRTSATTRAILTRSAVVIPDVLGDPEYQGSELARIANFRSVLSVPMLREGKPIGAITVTRAAVGPLPDKQIALLKTFADQAVIAIENVRLFNELQARNKDLGEALERQTATADVLRAISQAHTDVQPVFEAIADSVMRLFAAWGATVFRYDGEFLRLAAARGGSLGSNEAFLEWGRTPRRPDPEQLPLLGRTVALRAIQQVADVETDSSVSPHLLEQARERGWRSAVQAPMLRGDDVLGVISVTRAKPGAFARADIALLQTFADQAVIAVENARLLTELQARNKDLAESLERQTATADILRTISQAQTDVQPVFEAIADSAMRLFGAWSVLVFRYDGEYVSLAAARGGRPGSEGLLVEQYPTRRLSTDLPPSRVVLTRAVHHCVDTETDSTYPAIREYARTRGYRSFIQVPMLRGDDVLGVVSVAREQPSAFSPAEIALLQTFADQAVIAVENARLLTELQTRTTELQRSVGHLTALGEVGQAVSSSLDLETVLTTIVSRAVDISGLDGGVVFEYDEAAEEFVRKASTAPAGAFADAQRGLRLRKGEGVVGRTAITLEPVQTPDITVPGAHQSRLRETLIESGIRALLAVPMVREGHLIGSLVVSRNRPGAFPAETIDLLRTFATQSALAIQNARLFQEIADKSRQLEIASRHKSEFLANMSHELRTPLNAVIGFSEALLKRMFGGLTEKQDEYLKDIYASGQHLLSLINDILDLSKVEAGRMELELTDFDLPAAIDNALTLVRERAARRGIALGRAIDDGLGPVRADERKVKQVLLNLLSNALKFTPEGGRIDVRAAMNEAMAEISVVDTGVGIAPDDQEAIFEEFRQVGTSDKKVEGTGLGLALARKFIELHGGRIWVQSQIGQGATFTFTLPVRREEDGPS